MQTGRRNWILKRLALGLALTALVAPSAANARVDEGGYGQPNSSAEINKGAVGGSHVQIAGTDEWTVTSECRGCRRAGDNASAGPGASLPTGLPSGITREQLNDYLLGRDGVEVVRTHPRSTPTGVSTPQVVSSPGFDWRDAGVGAGVVLGLIVLAGAVIRTARHLSKPQTA